jgi:hypothetical protein
VHETPTIMNFYTFHMNKKKGHNILALMLDPKFKNMWLSVTYVGCDVILVLVATYDE